MDKPIIQLKNVSKSFRIPHEKSNNFRDDFLSLLRFKKKTYENFHALKDISFEVKKGEFLGIIGKNGSGKSTLLKILAKVYEPDSGEVIINGKVSPFLELGVGFNGELNARENIYLNGSLLGLSTKQIDEKFDKIIKFAELENFVDTKVKNYSSGMYARLAFSVAIEAEADIYLMDEVLAVGDANFQSKCFDVFSDYKAKGKTIILISHDTNNIQKYCSTALLLSNGQIVKSGNVQDVINEYQYENSVFLGNTGESKSCNIEGNDTSVYIESVTLCDEKGIEKSVFMTNSNLTIKVTIKNHLMPLTDVNIGIGIYSQEGVYIFSTNTIIDKHAIRESQNEVKLTLNQLPLLKGAYYLNIVCFGKQETQYFDFKPKIRSFNILVPADIPAYRGMYTIEHKWD